MANNLTRKNAFAVSLAKESAINTFATLVRRLYIDTGNVAMLDYRRENNEDELTGLEEVSEVYKLGQMSKMTIDLNKLRASDLAWLMAFYLGQTINAAVGNGYSHISTPLEDTEQPGFSAGMKYSGIEKRRLASMYGNTLTVTLEKDSFATASADIIGTGKFESNVEYEEVVGAYNDTTITLTGYVEGGSAAERLDNIHIVLCTNPSSYDELATVTAVAFAWAAAAADVGNTGNGTVGSVTAGSDAVPETITLTCTNDAVSGSEVFSVVGSRSGNLGSATVGVAFTSDYINLTITAGGVDFAVGDIFTIDPEPSELTITAVGGTGDAVTFKVTYESAGEPGDWLLEGWANIESLALPTDTPLRVNGLCLKIGGSWDGSTYSGGYSISRPLRSLEWSLDNRMMVEFRSGCDETDPEYANYRARGGRQQTLTLTRDLEDAELQRLTQQNLTFTIEATLTGAEFATGERYQHYLVFPKCKFINAEHDAGDNILGESLEIQVLEHETYGSVYSKVIDTTASYGA